ncbi:MAG TPA: hypothetical protein VJU61_20475 [Polyangiaceae bacterium]|nr:hypothetical protein [Polyangiaceae bacterium]
MSREWVRFAIAAALGAAAVIVFDAGSMYRKLPERGVAREALPHGGPTAAGKAVERVELSLRGSGSTPASNSYEYALTRDDWKQLAKEGRVRFRIPCPAALDSAWKLPQQELDELGLSPEEGETLAQLQRRSNVRVWDTLRPLCLKIVDKAEVVELLGMMSCQKLIEEVATRSDPAAVTEARRQVAEVHAGLRSPPAAGQPRHPVFEALLALSSEGARFEADLAESFGPEEARRIWRSMRCAATSD